MAWSGNSCVSPRPFVASRHSLHARALSLERREMDARMPSFADDDDGDGVGGGDARARAPRTRLRPRPRAPKRNLTERSSSTSPRTART